MHSTGDRDTVLNDHNNKRSLAVGVNGDSWKSESCQTSSSSSTSDAESSSSGHSTCHSSSGTPVCAGGCCGGSPVFMEDETSAYLTTKLRFESQLLKDKLAGRKHIAKSLFFSELIDLIFSWMALVDRAIVKLEQQDVIQDELYTSKQLLQLQKSRSARHMENFIKLEAQMKEVNEDYGQLLVEHGAQKKMIQANLNRVLHDSCSQTESVNMVDVGTLAFPEGKSLSVQTEPCVEVETQADEDMALDITAGEEENGRETRQGQGSAGVANVVAGNGCAVFTAVVVQSKDLKSASATGETQGISCLPSKRTPNDECPVTVLPETDGGQPLLCDHTRENAGPQDPVGPASITWPCDHYKRLCLVKFECCEKFYPCHRCHNNNADCPSNNADGPRKNLHAIDAKLLKCLSCNKVQNITENSQHCSKCGIEFATYFCGICQHFTGEDQKPYHCTPCGICRVKGDRSFHCDNCGVCLDITLRDNHVCREGSAHDACCICLEDAFSGCQILPCSHKVHKNCATMMIKNGLRKCPVCRQSFAHKVAKGEEKSTETDDCQPKDQKDVGQKSA